MLIKNVHLITGDDSVAERADVLITDARINRISTEPIMIDDHPVTKEPGPAGAQMSTVSTSLVMPRWRRFWGATAHYDTGTGQLISYKIKNRPAAVIERSEVQ